MRQRIFSVALSTVLVCGGAALAEQPENAGVVQFDGDTADAPASAEQPKAERTSPEAPIAEQSFVADEATGAPNVPANDAHGKQRYRFHNGRWWYQADDGGWLWRNGSRWVRYQASGTERGPSATMTAHQVQAAPGPTAPEPGTRGQPMMSEGFNSWFNAYRTFQTGRGQLRTAESGQVEMATSEIGEAETEATEAFEYGGIPRSQARRRRAGVGTASPGSGSWFNAGSPFGIRYGYGSGFGYGGYGYDNPYGYGSRSGSGGAYGYGFGAFGSVGGQTGERLSSLISGPSEEGGRLIGSETAGIGAPARLETAVGGTYGKAGAGARKLGGSASEGD